MQQLAKIADRADLDLLVAVIAHSQIILRERAGRTPGLPASFDDVDLAVLDWIADEGRRIGRSFAQM
jgi:hypothetical protein